MKKDMSQDKMLQRALAVFSGKQDMLELESALRNYKSDRDRYKFLTMWLPLPVKAPKLGNFFDVMFGTQKAELEETGYALYKDFYIQMDKYLEAAIERGKSAGYGAGYEAGMRHGRYLESLTNKTV